MFSIASLLRYNQHSYNFHGAMECEALELKLDGTSKIVLRPSLLTLIDTFFQFSISAFRQVSNMFNIEGYGKI